jgi:hypothetical protein
MDPRRHQQTPGLVTWQGDMSRFLRQPRGERRPLSSGVIDAYAGWIGTVGSKVDLDPGQSSADIPKLDQQTPGLVTWQGDMSRFLRQPRGERRPLTYQVWGELGLPAGIAIGSGVIDAYAGWIGTVGSKVDLDPGVTWQGDMSRFLRQPRGERRPLTYQVWGYLR